jgi:cathepsin F
MLETSDPYIAAYSGSCTLNKNELCAAKITKLIDVQNTQADLIAAMRNYGPVAISVGMADQPVWQSYLRGTIQCPTTAQIDHAVVAVGWSQENNYFIGKNQWSTSWGMNGFFYLDATQNCGLFQYTSQTVTVA